MLLADQIYTIAIKNLISSKFYLYICIQYLVCYCALKEFLYIEYLNLKFYFLQFWQFFLSSKNCLEQDDSVTFKELLPTILHKPRQEKNYKPYFRLEILYNALSFIANNLDNFTCINKSCYKLNSFYFIYFS